MANRRPLCPSPWRRHNTTIPRLQNLFSSFFLYFSSCSLYLSSPRLLFLLCVSMSLFFQSSSPSTPTTFFSFSFLNLYSVFLWSVHRSNTYMVFRLPFVTFLWKCSCLPDCIGGFSLHHNADWWQFETDLVLVTSLWWQWCQMHTTIKQRDVVFIYFFYGMPLKENIWMY